jgi:hypothetical protein
MGLGALGARKVKSGWPGDNADNATLLFKLKALARNPDNQRNKEHCGIARKRAAYCRNVVGLLGVKR